MSSRTSHSFRDRLLVAVFAALISSPALAQDQHDQHVPPPPDAPAIVGDMATSFPAREASGTAWLPDVTPMYGFHRAIGGWQFMVHGNAFAQFLYESGEDHHGGHQAGSINWVMVMADRGMKGGQLQLRAMASLEPWTIRGCGYPNLLATGEVCLTAPRPPSIPLLPSLIIGSTPHTFSRLARFRADTCATSPRGRDFHQASVSAER